MWRLNFILLCLGFVANAAAEIPVHRFPDAPHHYWTQQPSDAFTQWLSKAKTGPALFAASDEKTQLIFLLKALEIPESSQLLVYSATSFQSGLILPSNPRAIYFNEESYVGFVPSGRLEVSSVDPDLGPVFYLMRPSAEGRVDAVRSERCMNCHAGRTSAGVPGFVAESVIATASSGASLDGFRREVTGHGIPLRERFGGWHVTGVHEHGEHLGNLLGAGAGGGYERVSNPPGSRFDWNHYPVKTSDLFAHLLLEHQIGFHNLVTLGLYRTRDALTAGAGRVRVEDRAALDEIAWRLVRYLLFSEEAAIPKGGVQPDPVYANAFLARRRASVSGGSLRDLDLGTRLFKYRCSYMIYTRGFLLLPPEMKRRVFQGLSIALREQGAPPEFDYLPAEEKRAIRTILRETGLVF
jgi:hypothetical protein